MKILRKRFIASWFLEKRVSKMDFSDITLVAIDAALKAGKILKEGFDTQFSKEFKEGSHNIRSRTTGRNLYPYAVCASRFRAIW